MPSNFSRRAARKKQTRLVLDPVEPSSSATNPMVTPARIRYQVPGSSTKIFDLSPQRRGVEDEDDDVFASGKKYAVVIETPRKTEKGKDRNLFQHLISPVKSSQVTISDSGLDASVGSDDSDGDLETAPTHRVLPMRISAGCSLPDPTRDPSIGSQSTRQLPLGYDGADDDSSGQANINKKSTSLKSVSARNFLAGGSTYNAPIPKRSPPSVRANSGNLSKKPTKRGQASKPVVLSDNDSGQELALPTPRKTRSGIRKLGSEQYGSKDFSPSTKKLQGKRRSPNAIATEDEDEDNGGKLPDVSEIKTSSSNRRKPGAKVVDVMEIDEEDNDDECMFVRPSRKRVRATEVGDTDDDDEDPISPLKRRKAISTDIEESDASASMARTLQKEFDGEYQGKRLTRKQPRKAVHRTAAQKKIELLRRKRAGEDISEVTPTESDEEDNARGLYDSTSDSELQALNEFDDEETESGDDSIEKVRDSLRAENRNRYDEEFIVDDDETLGVPGHGLLDIPLQFTHQAHKPLKEHFKDAIDWMVQRKINPGFASKDEIYIQAFKKLGDEVHGYATSKFMSSSWNMDFNRALSARPYFSAGHIPPGTSESNKCEACNRSKHPATYQISFSGKAYSKATLDELDNGQDDDSDHTSVNSNDESIMGEDTIWLVGRFCKANAEIAHHLLHWKRALNDWVVDRIKADGHMDPDNLTKRTDWSKKQLRKYANEIVDGWEAEREIKSLYRDFKLNLERARNSKQGR